MTSSGMGLLIGMGNTNEVQLVWDARARFCCTLASISTLLNGDRVSFSLPSLRTSSGMGVSGRRGGLGDTALACAEESTNLRLLEATIPFWVASGVRAPPLAGQE